MMMKRNITLLILVVLLLVGSTSFAQSPNRRPFRRPMAYVSDTVMVHDPVMAYENGLYYLLSTGRGVSWATSKDRKSWVIQPTPFIEEIPAWAPDSVPGFRGHVWAPDIIYWHDRWWLSYSCSTFGKNTSAIGLMSTESLTSAWKDEGCIVRSEMGRDNWNAIDSNFIIDENDQPWLVWGSFWDGIQMARLDETMHLASEPVTVARRYSTHQANKPENPTSQYAGQNAIEAPFIFRHGDYYYLFVSWDYCCRGAQSNYRVAVGRSKTVNGPYVDRNGKMLTEGGGTLVMEGDKKEFEAAGHSAAYHFGDEDIFICHGYSTGLGGASILIQRSIKWTDDGWLVISE